MVCLRGMFFLLRKKGLGVGEQGVQRNAIVGQGQYAQKKRRLVVTPNGAIY